MPTVTIWPTLGKINYLQRSSLKLQEDSSEMQFYKQSKIKIWKYMVPKSKSEWIFPGIYFNRDKNTKENKIQCKWLFPEGLHFQWEGMLVSLDS